MNYRVVLSSQNQSVTYHKCQDPEQCTEIIKHFRVVILRILTIIIRGRVLEVAIKQKRQQDSMVNQTEQSASQDSVEYQYTVIQQVHHMAEN